jgi:hypothetical protein
LKGKNCIQRPVGKTYDKLHDNGINELQRKPKRILVQLRDGFDLHAS